ncbi:MAG: PIG-L deacetylase family protein [Nitrospirota bacterium]
MLLEQDLIPYDVAAPPGQRSIVLAPHPDDESIGCGGTIRLLVNAKKSVKVVFLTSGDKADPSHKLSRIVHHGMPGARNTGGLTESDHLPRSPFHGEGTEGSAPISHLTGYALLREQEAEKALHVLGVSDYEFLRFPDRELHRHYHDAEDRLSRISAEYRPDAVYSPSVIELNPDHRTTASLAIAMHGRMASEKVPAHSLPVRLLFYEVTSPLRPNLLVDISSAYRAKKKAIRKYASQMKLMNYLDYITALNMFRTLTVQGVRYAEAFWVSDLPLTGEAIAGWLTYQKKTEYRAP